MMAELMLAFLLIGVPLILCAVFIKLDEWNKNRKKNNVKDNIENSTYEYEEVCRYYKEGKCTAGGQNYSCSANPNACENCYVWKYHTTGDVSVLY